MAGLLCIPAAAAQESSETRFKRFDANNDGVVTPDELPNDDAFRRFDKNGDRKITPEEAQQAPPTRSGGTRIDQDPHAKPIERPLPLGKPHREFDPVITTGAAVPGLNGVATAAIVAFAYDGTWRQIPVQIDERFVADLSRIRTGSGSFKTLVYADAAMRTGADPDPTFDADDELTLMYRDCGARAPSDDPSGVSPGSRIELKIVDELTPAERFAYLFVSAGKLSADAGKDYVDYRFQLLSGNNSGPGPNPEDSAAKTSRYRNHFSERWVHDGTEITAGDATGVDILDRDEFNFKPGICNRTTDTFSEGAGAQIANRDGPVRGIRSVVGCNSGTYTQRDYFFYEGRMTVRNYYRVHPIGNTWNFYDFSPAAAGMTYYDNQNLGGVAVDGKPDDVKTDQPLTWQLLTGKQGSLTIAWTMETDIPKLHRFAYYFDDATNWKRCTGDDFAYAASGPATGELPNTDPILQSRTSVHHLVTERIVFYDAPDLTVEQAQARVTAGWFPLRAETTAPTK